MKTNKKAIVFGAGFLGKKTFERMSCEYTIISFCDNNKQKHGQLYCGLPVLPPEALKECGWDIIIIGTIIGATTIRCQLIDMGISADNIIEDPAHRIHNAARRNALKNVRDLLVKSGQIGSVAEVGVYQGEFAAQINEFFPDSILYLFDTFDGMASIEHVLKLMPHPKRCIFKKGLFPGTAAGIEDMFSFVSLDVNLYHPTLEGLKFFYPRMRKGGYIFLHDYFYTANSGVIAALHEFAETVDLHFAPLGDDCSVIIVK